MKFFLASVLFCSSVLCFMQGWVLVSLLLVTMFSVKYGAVLFIPVAIILDGYYGSFFAVPALSIGAIGWFLVIEYTRPKLAKLVF